MKEGIYLCQTSKNTIHGNTIESSGLDGIYLNKSTDYITVSGVSTYCVICKEKIAKKYFIKGEDKDFRKILESSHYPKDVWNKIHILGVCDGCCKKAVREEVK